MTIIDTHAHIFPDPIAEKAAGSISRFYGIQMNCDGRLSTLLRQEKEAGVSKILVCSAATTSSQTPHINDYIAQTVQDHPGRLYGLGAMHQDFPHKEAEVERLKAMGLRGVKIHPDIQGVAMNDPRFDALYGALSEHNLVLLAHTGDLRYHNSNTPEILDVLARFPRLKIICAHLGSWSNWTQGVTMLAGRENVYVDISSSLYALTPEKAAEIVRAYGANRVLFGSDFPMWTPAGELEKLARLGLTKEETECVLHKNAEELLGIEG